MDSHRGEVSVDPEGSGDEFATCRSAWPRPTGYQLSIHSPRDMSDAGPVHACESPIQPSSLITGSTVGFAHLVQTILPISSVSKSRTVLE